MKKIVSIMLAMIMTFSIVPVSAVLAFAASCSTGHDDIEIYWDEFWDEYFDDGSKEVYWECYECENSDYAAASISSKTTVAATCTAKGSKTYTAKIKVNGKTYSDSCKKAIAKTGHNYGSNVTKKATLTANGKVTATCKSCKNVKTIKIIYRPKTFTLAGTSYVYTGKAIKPAVTIKDVNGNKISSSNYTVTYSNNTKVGTAKVSIKLKGNYTGTKAMSFKIISKPSVAKVTGLKAASVAKNSVKLSWTKVSGATGYIVYKYIVSQKKYVKLATVSGTTKSITGLAANTTYKFAVKAYKTVSGKNYYGKCSALLTVKTKGSSSSSSSGTVKYYSGTKVPDFGAYTGTDLYDYDYNYDYGYLMESYIYSASDYKADKYNNPNEISDYLDLLESCGFKLTDYDDDDDDMISFFYYKGSTTVGVFVSDNMIDIIIS